VKYIGTNITIPTRTINPRMNASLYPLPVSNRNTGLSIFNFKRIVRFNKLTRLH